LLLLVPLQDVFLLPVQSVGTLTYLTKTAFCLCILVRLLLAFFLFLVLLFLINDYNYLLFLLFYNY
jgi:hypothetical protein